MAAPRRHLQFVFIEGAAATGKSSLCQELHKRGYTVQFENFVELCAKVSVGGTRRCRLTRK